MYGFAGFSVSLYTWIGAFYVTVSICGTFFIAVFCLFIRYSLSHFYMTPFSVHKLLGKGDNHTLDSMCRIMAFIPWNALCVTVYCFSFFLTLVVNPLFFFSTVYVALHIYSHTSKFTQFISLSYFIYCYAKYDSSFVYNSVKFMYFAICILVKYWLVYIALLEDLLAIF